MKRTRIRRFSLLAGAAALVGALVAGVGESPVSAAVTAVKGSAYGYSANVGLGGGPPNPRGPAPEVTLPSTGSASPITASATESEVAYGPAIFFSSGPIALSTQGTTGSGGSVTTSTDIQTINTSQSEVFTAERLQTTCTASETGVSASTTVTNGTIVLQDPNPNTSGEPGEDIRTIPTNPAPNTTYSGEVAGVGDDFQAVFNEQVVNPDGSITVYGYHLTSNGFAVGDLYTAKAECGVTSDTPPTTVPPTTVPPFDSCDGLTATIVGTDGRDIITGTSWDDVIVGLGGNDRIDGGDGDDVICGGDGNDTLVGGPGDDTILGQAGNDSLAGRDGDDELDGGDGNDKIVGGDGDDDISGSGGDNTILGDAGNDRIRITEISTGADFILGGPGDDMVTVDLFPVTLGANDFFSGGAGNDFMNGVLDGGQVLGGDGDDQVLLMDAGTFYGGPGNDSVSSIRGMATFFGEDGNDSVGSNLAGLFRAGPGDDRGGSVRGTGIYLAGDGNDTASATREQGLYCGGLGDDSLTFLSSTSVDVRGGTFIGEEGNDTVGFFFPGGTFVQDGDCPVE